MDRRPLLLMLLVLAGCARGGVDAPSLAPRAIERAGVPAPDATAEPIGSADPALAPRLAALVAAADAGHRRFDEARRVADAAAARPGVDRAGGEAWAVAQQALSALDAARGDVRAAAADLDSLRIDPAFAGATDRGAIDAAAARIAALEEEEAAAIAAVETKLG